MPAGRGHDRTARRTESQLLGLRAPGGAPERSTDFAWLTDATRIEPNLDLHGEDFGVHFFNDATRFNFGPEVMPGRDQLPFSVRWSGWLLAQSDGARRFVLDADGPARVALDGRAAGVAGHDPRAHQRTAPVTN